MGSREPHAERESWLKRKVCGLCRGLETGISVMLKVRNGLGILFNYRHIGYIYDVAFNYDNHGYKFLLFPL
jgi:hypothetical protein